MRRNEFLVWDAEQEDVLLVWDAEQEDVLLLREAVLVLSVLSYENASLVIEVPFSKVLWPVAATSRRRGADDDHNLWRAPASQYRQSTSY